MNFVGVSDLLCGDYATCPASAVCVRPDLYDGPLFCLNKQLLNHTFVDPFICETSVVTCANPVVNCSDVYITGGPEILLFLILLFLIILNIAVLFVGVLILKCRGTSSFGDTLGTIHIVHSPLDLISRTGMMLNAAVSVTEERGPIELNEVSL
uniref:Uncharacterized protein n=1 Tax=Panagrolaimus superbus TaxID=310955 RepID=A0A914Y3U5_9BILA